MITTVYKSVRLWHGNDFDKVVENHLASDWAIYNIWAFSGHGPSDGYVGKQQVIITFIRQLSIGKIPKA